jgi:hypothetical protein
VADLQLGVRHARSDQFADSAEEQYGLMGNYETAEGVALRREYLHNELPPGGDEEIFAGRVSIEF